MNTQRRYATCPKGMSKKREKRCIPNQGLPHAYKACQKKKKREKDSPHPRKIKKRDGSCKGVHPPSAKKNHKLAHLDQIV